MNNMVRSQDKISDFEEASDLGCILVVDDGADLLDIVSRMLSESGFDVEKAGNGAEAFHLFSEVHCSLVLTDLNMPVMDGLSLARKIKRRSPATPVIIMTGADDLEIVRVEESGCVESILKKPFDWQALTSTVSSVLDAKNRDFIDQREILNPEAFRGVLQDSPHPGL